MCDQQSKQTASGMTASATLKGVTSWLVLGMFLYAVTMVLKRRSTLFTLHMAYMADIINYNDRKIKDEVNKKGTE